MTNSPQVAFKLCDGIVESIGSLAEMPKRCVLLKTPELRVKEYCALHVKNYMVFYVVMKDTVQIRCIFYAKRQFEYLL